MAQVILGLSGIFYLGIAVFVLYMLYRGVKALEKIADAYEKKT